jgi:hypothetical protein
MYRLYEIATLLTQFLETNLRVITLYIRYLSTLMACLCVLRGSLGKIARNGWTPLITFFLSLISSVSKNVKIFKNNISIIRSIIFSYILYLIIVMHRLYNWLYAWKGPKLEILFYSILFCSILFCYNSILYSSVLFYYFC